MSRAAGAIRVVRSRVKKIRAPQRQALTFTPAAITKLQVKIVLELRGFSGYLVAKVVSVVIRGFRVYKVKWVFPVVIWSEFRMERIETTTIGMTHPTLASIGILERLFKQPILKLKL